MKFQISLKGFEKSSNIKFHENPFKGSRVVSYKQTEKQTDRETDRQTDLRAERHGEANSCFAQFC